jgi:hypothetical protein
MAVLQLDSVMVGLTPRALVGRSSRCCVRVEDRTVSGEHAAFAWLGDRWTVRDLGSRNGTRVDGATLKPGERVPVSAGTVIECGSSRMTLVTDGAPGPAVVSPTGAVVETLGNVLALPSVESPAVTLVQSGQGWVIEQSDRVTPVIDGGRLEVGSELWTVLAPRDDGELVSTVQLEGAPPQFGQLTLEFIASRDEEHVELNLQPAGLRISARTANYLLLVLARERRSDANLPESDRGWVYSSDLARQMSFDLERLNVEVFRARSALSGLGVQDAGRVIERRALTRQLRIGTERFVLPEHRGTLPPAEPSPP